MQHVNQGEHRSTAHHHATVAEARQCEADYAQTKWEWENDPDRAYERHLENVGWADKFVEEQHHGFPSQELYAEWLYEGELELEASY